MISTTVDQGSSAAYLANASDPGIGTAWTATTFDDSVWSSGPYGVGYESASGAENLIQTTVPTGTISIYTRVAFTISDVAAVGNLVLESDYDDGYVAWVNGVEVYRSPSMPLGPVAWNTAPVEHESSNGTAPVYEQQDISSIAIPSDPRTRRRAPPSRRLHAAARNGWHVARSRPCRMGMPSTYDTLRVLIPCSRSVPRMRLQFSINWTTLSHNDM